MINFLLRDKHLLFILDVLDEDSNLTSLYSEVSNWPANGTEPGVLPLTVGKIAGVAFDNIDDKVVLFHRGTRILGCTVSNYSLFLSLSTMDFACLIPDMRLLQVIPRFSCLVNKISLVKAMSCF